MSARVIRKAQNEIGKHLGAVLEVMQKLTPQQRRRLQAKIGGLSRTNCWFVTYDAREFLQRSIAWVRDEHNRFCRRRKK